MIVNELLIFSALVLGVLYADEFTKQKKKTPISLLLNAGILNVIIFFITAVSSSLFNRISDFESIINFFYSITSSLIGFIFIGSITYIFSAFKELTLLRQKRDPRKFYNTMIIFISLAFWSNILTFIDKELDFVSLSFYVVAIILIAINSLRVSWIAFLVKKQKIYLLIISTILSVLFGLNFSLTFDNNFIRQILISFSPGLHLFLSLIMIYGTIYFGVIFFTTLFHLPTAEAFDRKAEEASSLMDLSKLITQVFDFKELADTITSLTTRVCNSDSAWLVIENESGLELNSVSNIGYIEADSLTKTLMEEGSISKDELSTFDKKRIKIKVKTDIRTFDFKALAVAPLKVHSETCGFLFTARKHNLSFDEDDRNTIEAYADYAAVALENAKLIKESIEKERLESELNVAREIQYKILPSEIPEYERLKISALFVPAFEVGGDYYDFFEIGNDSLGFVIADVSGKGISASFIMAEVKGIFETLSKLIVSPKKLLIKANEILINSLEKKNFVTAVYGIINRESGQVIFSRAGHVPIYLGRNGKVESLIPEGIGLGLDNTTIFTENIKEMEIQLNNDDILILFTDGITEAKNQYNEEFGDYRFKDILKTYSNSNVNEISNKIIKSVSVFSKDTPQHDDITLLLFKWVNNN
ncbi:SpoIIE family protein phosphatase [Bacteroidota bacterium]